MLSLNVGMKSSLKSGAVKSLKLSIFFLISFSEILIRFFGYFFSDALALVFKTALVTHSKKVSVQKSLLPVA